VGLLLGGDGRELDHQVRFHHQLLQQFGSVVLLRHVALEHLASGQQNLVGRLASATLATHAVSHDAHGAPLGPRMHDDFDLILLVGPVSLVESCRGGQAEGLGGRIHDAEYKLPRCPLGVEQ
jgi:hypothetical protein